MCRVFVCVCVRAQVCLSTLCVARQGGGHLVRLSSVFGGQGGVRMSTGLGGQEIGQMDGW